MDIQAHADKLNWFHEIDLGNGVITKGAKSREIIKRQADIAFAYGVSGKSVVDIGAWDGAFSFEAERRGASRVVAVDHYCWVGPLRRKACFDFAKRTLASNVEEIICTVEDLSPASHGHFDIALFLGVLYHLRNPFLGLEKAAAMTNGTLIVDTETALDTLDRPAMAFIPGNELNNDPTNWWAPNIACVKAMLTDLGLSKIEVVRHPNPFVPQEINERRGRYMFIAQR
jgi:tRNA (mo5U34)-methyltransferase